MTSNYDKIDYTFNIESNVVASKMGTSDLADPMNLQDLSRDKRKSAFFFPTWSDTNQAVQLQKMARDLKFQI